jgi:RNA polymerase sigma factor for flagellar operon FliA
MTATAADPRQLIESCQGMVRSLALSIRRKLPPQVELDDLIGYGEVGLAEAARDFDPSQGSQFSTFAYYRIRGAIYDGVSKMTWFGRAGQAQIRGQQRTNEVLQAESERAQDTSAATLEDDARWFRDLSRALAVVYLASFGSAAEKRDFDFVDPAASPPQTAIDEELVKLLHAQIDALSAEESKFIRALYFEGQTLQQAGEQLGIGKSWASRLHHKVLQRLAKSLAGAGVEI